MIDIVDKIEAGKKIEAKNGNFEKKADKANNINNLHKAVEVIKIITYRLILRYWRSLIVG